MLKCAIWAIYIPESLGHACIPQPLQHPGVSAHVFINMHKSNLQCASFVNTGVVQANRIWSHQGDSMEEPEVAGLANYDATKKWWKPAGAPVAVKMYNIASALFGKGTRCSRSRSVPHMWIVVTPLLQETYVLFPVFLPEAL